MLLGHPAEMLRLLPSLLALLFLAHCAPSLEPAQRLVRDPLAQSLSAFEDLRLLPPEIADLPLDPGRAYVILVQLPGPAIVDLSDPSRARTGLAMFLNPVAVLRAGTALGHVMVGWRCADGASGLTSQTGDTRDLGYRMLAQGWGLAALLAEYDDGHLVTLAELPARQRRALGQGRARILAEEVPEAGCQRLRRSLALHMARPAAERARFGMVASPAAPLGTGCGGFAVWLAGQGGALRRLAPHLVRSVVLRDSFVGTGRQPAPPGVTPPPMAASAPVPLLGLLTNDWTQGRALAELRILDMELLLHALDHGSDRPPRLDPADPAVLAVTDAAQSWQAAHRHRRPVRIGAATATLLHRS